MAESKSTQLINTIKASNSLAFSTLFNLYYKALCAFAYKFIHDAELVEDIVQQLYMKIWEKRDDLPEVHSDKSYLFSAVRNACIDHIRHSKVHPQINLDLLEQKGNIDQSVEEIMISNEQAKILHNAIEQLPEQRKKVLKMSKLSGLRYKEIAEKLQISVKTVETHMGAALKQIKQLVYKTDLSDSI